MVYKRYIRKNGILHGPYYYESYRENGKIKKRYIGTKLPLNEGIKQGNLENPIKNLVTPHQNSFFSRGGNWFLAIFVGLVLVCALVSVFNSLPKQMAVLEIEPKFSLNEQLSGKAIIAIEKGDYIPANTNVLISIVKDGVILASKSDSLDGFLDGKVEVNDLTEEKEVCEDVTTNIPDNNCENTGNGGSDSGGADSGSSDADSEGLSPTASVIDDGSASCIPTYTQKTEKRCKNETISLGRVYNTPGEYSRDLEELLDYNLSEPGDYEISFSISYLDLNVKKSFVVESGLSNESDNAGESVGGGINSSGNLSIGEIGNTSINETSNISINETNVIGNQTVRIRTTRDRIKLGQPVKWVKNISVENTDNSSSGEVKVELPKQAENIEVNKIDNGEEVRADANILAVTASAISELDSKKGIFSWLNSLSNFITGNVVESNNETESNQSIQVVLQDGADFYTIEYETPAPTSTEKEIENGKEVVISAPSELNYTDVLSYTNISETLNVGQERKIRVYWVEEKSYVPFDAYDSDANGKLDYVEWVTPHLSNQTFDIILDRTSETGTSSSGRTTYLKLLDSSPYDSLVGYWSFDFDNSSTVFDLKGQNDGVINGGVVNVQGLYGNASSFDGVDDYIDLGNSSSFDLYQGFTISVWVNPSSFSGYQNAVFAEPNAQFGIVIFDDGHWEAQDNVVGSTFGGNLSLGVWSHLIEVYN